MQVIALLTQLAVARICPADYIYHTTPCPWLQVALLRILQYFPLPEEYMIKNKLNEVLTTILTNTEVTKSVNKNNGEHAVLFEAVNIVIKQGEVCAFSHRRAKIVVSSWLCATLSCCLWLFV